MKKILYTAVLGIFAVSLASCDDFLSELPDNRTEVDSEEKVAKILVSAYSPATSAHIAELMSDNVIDMGADNPYQQRWATQVANWEDATESGNDDAASAWGGYYNAIANANQALEGIAKLEEQAGETLASLDPYRGEALVSRAYNHFMLVNTFCWHYNEISSVSDPGIPYIEYTETELDPKYRRGTVLETYLKIERDLLAGLPLIDDAVYKVPKYHMNRNAALAFAMRFYLFKGEWDKVVEYGNQLFGSYPAGLMRDWKSTGATTVDYDAWGYAYMSASEKANFLLKTSYSTLFFPAYYSYQSRFTHSGFLADNETFYATGPWGSVARKDYYAGPFGYGANNHDITVMPKNPYLFEYTDQVAGIGYNRAVTIEFCGDLAILDRAEAHIMMGNYDLAIADMNTWLEQMFKTNKSVSLTSINNFYNRIQYYYPLAINALDQNARSVKHELNPLYSDTIDDVKENMIHAVLLMRRIQTIQEGWRWYDLKRYGISVYRIRLNEGEPDTYNVMEPDDLRRAVQIPADVQAAGMAANPRGRHTAFATN